MLNRNDILKQAERKYPAYLASLITGDAFFPLSLTLGKTRRATTYEARRDELAEVRTASHELGFELRWITVSDPRFGTHDRPASACFELEAAYLKALGKTAEVARFQQDAQLILEACPHVRDWLASNPRCIVQHHGRWPRMLRVVAWLLEHPRCGLYLRQLPIPGVDTKFIETHSRFLDSLLIALNPSRGHDVQATFHTRHGLREEESLVRIRFLDPELRSECGLPPLGADVSLPVSAIAALPIRVARIFITENLRNFLALPPHPRAALLFGGGDASARLKGVPWLRQCDVFYWGDLDLHGFAILSRLRTFAPHARNIMMDQVTLEKHLDFAIPDETELPSILFENLNETERNTCEKLKRDRLRLEQERVSILHVLEELSAISIRGESKTNGDQVPSTSECRDKRLVEPSGVVIRSGVNGTEISIKLRGRHRHLSCKGGVILSSR